MKKIILCPNAARDNGFEMTLKADKILKKCGRRTALCPLVDDAAFEGVPKGLEATALEDELLAAELIITFGGDGTILRAARAVADYGIPILGVNMGGKGFLAELEPDDIGQLEAAAYGDYKLDCRMMLDIELKRGGETVYKDFALNDAVISGVNKVIDLTMFGDGQRISRFSGDGAIIATPTGSTAYSMAAGGPIVEPSAQNIIITPVCAHVLQAKPFVLVSDRRVSVEIGYKKSNPAYMSVDGCDYVPIASGDVVNVSKSEKVTRLVLLSGRSFYKRVSDKLGGKI